MPSEFRFVMIRTILYAALLMSQQELATQISRFAF